MSGLSHRVDRSMLQIGDHIYSYRNAHLYSNHGIYVGEDRVIHYMSSSESNESSCRNCVYEPAGEQRGQVVKTCLDCFLKGHSLHRFEYNVSKAHYIAKRSGTCYTGSCDKPDVVVRRATKMLDNENTGRITSGTANNFNLFDKKSVCFAVWCMTGNPDSVKDVAAKSKIKMVLGVTDALVVSAAPLTSLYDIQNNDVQDESNQAEASTSN